MSVLANEVLEYLERTGNRSTKNWLRTKFQVSSHTMTIALEELGDKLHNTIDCGGRVYFAPAPKAKQKVVLQAPNYTMRPYQQPSTLTERHREIEAQREAFPSRFN